MSAQTNKNSRKREGLCEKMCSPFRIRRAEHRPQPSTPSVANEKKLPVHQSQMVPVEFKHRDAATTATTATGATAAIDGRKAPRKGRNFAEREEKIVNDHQKLAKSASKTDQTLAKVKSKKEDDDHSVHESKFSDYIDKFKRRMHKTASTVGGASGRAGGGSGGGGGFAKGDSFSDKATNYITRARLRIRATTTLHDGRNISFK